MVVVPARLPVGAEKKSGCTAGPWGCSRQIQSRRSRSRMVRIMTKAGDDADEHLTIPMPRGEDADLLG